MLLCVVVLCFVVISVCVVLFCLGCLVCLDFIYVGVCVCVCVRVRVCFGCVYFGAVRFGSVRYVLFWFVDVLDFSLCMVLVCSAALVCCELLLCLCWYVVRVVWLLVLCFCGVLCLLCVSGLVLFCSFWCWCWCWCWLWVWCWFCVCGSFCLSLCCVHVCVFDVVVVRFSCRVRFPFVSCAFPFSCPFPFAVAFSFSFPFCYVSVFCFVV